MHNTFVSVFHLYPKLVRTTFLVILNDKKHQWSTIPPRAFEFIFEKILNCFQIKQKHWNLILVVNKCEIACWNANNLRWNLFLTSVSMVMFMVPPPSIKESNHEIHRRHMNHQEQYRIPRWRAHSRARRRRQVMSATVHVLFTTRL